MNSQFVKAIRMYHGLSQADFAKKLGVSPATIGMIELGYRRVSDRIKAKIASEIDLDDSFYIYYHKYTKLPQ